MRLAVLMVLMFGCATLAALEIVAMVKAVPVPAAPASDVRPAPEPEPPLAAPARADSCAGQDLRVHRQAIGAGAGVAYGRLVVTNTGQRPCTVQGYPVIQGVRAGLIALRSDPVPGPDGGPGPLIPLRPEQSASAAYRRTLVGPPGCPPYDRTQVIVPHAVPPFPLDGSGVRACAYRVQTLTGGSDATWNPS